MIWTLAWSALLFGAAPPSQAAPVSVGESVRRWEPIELSFEGPFAKESDDAPNPFLDYRLQVEFVAPSGARFDVPGFFDGDADGGGVGTTWKARFAADEVGTWTWAASFRQGSNVAINLDPGAGTALAFDGLIGQFNVAPALPDAPGFLAHGRLQHVGEHYLRFQDGTWFLKTGTNSPENLLGYSGFDDVQDMGGAPQSIIHDYDPHVGDWQPGDPYVGAAGSKNGLKGIVGALNYLSNEGVNSVYFLPMNLGGDGQETAPFLEYVKTPYAKTHYDTSRLAQWNVVLEHATRRGLQLQFVLSETEQQNEKWLDEGFLGVERKLFFRELVARFAHNLAIKWNLGEENDFGIANLQGMSEYLHAVDPYDHPICVHTHPDDFSDYWALLGDAHFGATSIQYSNSMAGQWTEEWRTNSSASGQFWVVDLDENGTASEGLSDTNAEEMRKEVLYDVLFSGGGVEWYLGGWALPVGGDSNLEDFRTRGDMWRYARFAREVLEKHVPFWLMEPDDGRVTGESPAYGGAEVFAHANRDFAVYLPDASQTAQIDLSDAPGTLFSQRWFDPREGDFVGVIRYVAGGKWSSLGSPPYAPGEDWVVMLQRLTLFPDVEEISASDPAPQNLFLDAGPNHASETYLILGSVSGIGPGVEVLGVHMPLNLDGWMLWTAQNPNTEVTQDFYGVLNSKGRALAAFDPTGGMGPSLIGMTFNHAFLAGPWSAPAWASNPVALKVVP
jgi:hypothetical protein